MIECPKPISASVNLPNPDLINVKKPKSYFHVIRLRYFDGERLTCMDDVGHKTREEAFEEAFSFEDNSYSLRNDVIALQEINQFGKIVKNLDAEQLILNLLVRLCFRRRVH